jgi:hypothetical protein
VALTGSATIAVDPQGNVYLPDYFSVREYDPNGTQVATVHLGVDPSEVVIAGTTLYARSGSGATSEITPYTLSGAAAGPAMPVPDQDSGALPYAMIPDLAASPDQLVATTTDHQIARFGVDGTHLGTWGGLAADDLSPVAAFEDAGGDVDVVDIAYGHARVVRYDARRDPPTQHRFSIPVSGKALVKLNWNALARRLFRHRSKVNAILTANYRTGPKSTTITRRVVLRRHRQSPARHRRRHT